MTGTVGSASAGIGDGAPRVEVVGLSWERPQLVIWLRSGGGPADAATVRLVRVGDPAVELAPTGSRRDADLLGVRYNVMVGPGLRPLEPGRWQVRLGGEDRPATDPLIVSGTVDVAAATRSFGLQRGTYRVTPVIEPSDGGLALDVSLEKKPERRRGVVRTVLHRIRRRVDARDRALRIMFSSMKVVRRRSGRRILFVSGSRTGVHGNMKIVRDRLVERGLDRDHDLRTTNRLHPGHVPSIRESIAICWEMAAADVILIEGTRQKLVYGVDFAPDVRVIQLWHASGAFKAVGYSRVGRSRGLDPWSRIHKNYTYAIVSSRHDAPFYAEAFGIPEARVVPTGIPRMDRFFDELKGAAGRAAALAAYPEADGRMTILFAPTYRRGSDGSFTFPIELIDYAALHAVCVEKDAIAIIRMHPFARTDLGIPEPFRDRILDGFRGGVDVNDLLFVVDLLITDYSSILFEYSTLGRPMLFFAFDLDRYIDQRDLYVPFESFVPGRTVRTFPELIDAIRRDDYEIDKATDFAARHFEHLDAGSTDRVIDQLILGR